MKKVETQRLKKLKKVFYRGRTARLKRVVVVMLVAGILAAMLDFCRYTYLDYASSQASIVLTYPEIAKSQKPDHSRFTYYEFISDDNISAAMESMQQDGKYTNYSVADLRDCFELYSRLENSATSSVSAARSEGDDYSYVANEYSITYVQPHDYGNSSILKRIFSPDYSVDFLNELIAVNRECFAEKTGGYNGFKLLTAVDHTENYDFTEKLRVYKTKINAIISFLNTLHGAAPDFHSSDGHSLKDMEGKYRFLISDKLDGISNFIESSGISWDAQQAANKIKVNIENNTLKYNKYLDRSKINQFAMKNYDQTFTENLINVIQNNQYGLYQARPKTAFDTVVEQKHSADESIAKYSAIIQQYNRDLAIYSPLSPAALAQPANGGPAVIRTTPEERERLIEKCEDLLQSMEESYKSITDSACQVVEEYYNSRNKNYINAKVKHCKLFTKALLLRLGFAFLVGAVLAFILTVFAETVMDSRRLKRKQRELQEIKQSAGEEE